MCVNLNDPVFYVYVYLDPRKPGKYVYGEYMFDYEPFYVGKGNGKRAYRHLKGNKSNKYFNNKIKKIQKIKSNPIIMIYNKKLLEQIAFDIEIKMIDTIGRHDLKKGPLCNLTDGGEGNCGNINAILHMKTNNPMFDPDTVRKVGKIKSLQMTGKTYEEIHTPLNAKNIKELASIRMKKDNPMFNQDTVIKVQQTKKQRTYKPRIVSEAVKQLISEKNSRNWYVTYPNGSELKITNLNQFCKKNNLSNGHMVNVANGERQTHKGFKCRRFL